jgi:hypothetical protein
MRALWAKVVFKTVLEVKKDVVHPLHSRKSFWEYLIVRKIPVKRDPRHTAPWGRVNSSMHVESSPEHLDVCRNARKLPFGVGDYVVSRVVCGALLDV